MLRIKHQKPLCFYIFLIATASLLWVNPHNASAAKLRILNRCALSIRSLLTPRLDIQKLKRFIRSKTSVTAYDQTLEVLSELYRQTGNYTAIEQFLSGIRDDYDLNQRLDWYFDAIQKFNDGEISMADFLNFPGFELASLDWKKLKGNGWSVKFVSGWFKQKGLSAQTQHKKNLIRMRIAPTFTPPPLLAAGHIFYNQNAFRLRESVLLESLYLKISYLIAQTVRLSPKAHAKGIRSMIQYILIRDVIFKMLNSYKLLIADHPEYKTNIWEIMRIQIDSKSTDKELGFQKVDQSIQVLSPSISTHLQNDFAFFQDFQLSDYGLSIVKNIDIQDYLLKKTKGNSRSLRTK